MNKPSLHDQFMDLLLRHQGQVFGYIFAAVHNLHDAQELYQETSLVLWSKFSTYRPDSDFARWACRTAKFKVLNFQRQKHRSPLYFDSEILSDFAEIYVSKDREAVLQHQEVLAECVEQLSAVDQQIVDLCYGSQGSIKRAAEKLERAPKTLYNAVSRIRRALFNCVRGKLVEGQSDDR